MIPFRTQTNRFLPPPQMMGQRGNVGPIDFGVNIPMPIPQPQPQPQIRTMEDRMGAGQQIPTTTLPNNPQANIPAVNLPFRPPSFGQTQQQPFQPQPIAQPQPQPQPPPEPQQRVPGVNAPIDFASEYAKLNSNRPNRLAYQQAVEQGSPQIKRGKLAKLGAIIAAAGGSMGPGGAQAGANLGLSSYYAPQSRADEAYDKRTKGLANLANFEEQDLQGQIKALEVKHGDYWKQQEADRFARGENRADTAEARLGKMSEAQIEEMKANREESNWMKYNNTKTGKMMIYNRITGKTQEVGDIGLTTDEQFDQFKKELVEKERVLEVGRRAGDLRDRETQWGTADRNNLSKQAIADANNATKIQQTLGKMGNVNKMLKPGEAATQVWNDLTGTIATDKKSFANMGDISDYIDVEGLGTSNAIVKIKPPSYWDSDEDKAIKEKLRATIEESYKRVNTKPPSTTPNLTTPKVVAPQAPGGRNTGPALPPGFTFRDK